MRILIVEDEWLIAQSVEETLMGAGHEVVGTVGSLEKARRALAAGGFDAVVLDANLRGATSEPFAAALTERGLAYLVISGYGSGQRNGLLAAAPFLRKPFSAEELLEQIRMLGP